MQVGRLRVRIRPLVWDNLGQATSSLQLTRNGTPSSYDVTRAGGLHAAFSAQPKARNLRGIYAREQIFCQDRLSKSRAHIGRLGYPLRLPSGGPMSPANSRAGIERRTRFV